MMDLDIIDDILFLLEAVSTVKNKAAETPHEQKTITQWYLDYFSIKNID
jgi:hypothetical protein